MIFASKILAEDYSVESLAKSAAAMLEWLEGEANKSNKKMEE